MSSSFVSRRLPLLTLCRVRQSTNLLLHQTTAAFATSSVIYDDVRKTALYDFHVSRGGKMVPFAGWLMPVQYSDMGIIESHLHTRRAASLFDVSHMLQTKIKGKNAIDFVETIVVADIAGLPAGKGSLTVMTTDKGGIVDDLIVTKVDEEYLYVVSNAGCADKDLAHLKTNLALFKAKGGGAANLEIISDHSLLALQGPAAKLVLQEGLAKGVDLSKLPFMHSMMAKLFGIDSCRITRCGYTGEDGVEISVPAVATVQLAEALLRNKLVRLAGLGARDTLRLEAGLCLYGNDIDETTTPVEAGLSWLIGKRRRQLGNFPGASVIIDQLKDSSKVKKQRVGLISRSGPPARHDAKVVLASDNKTVVGKVTSGTVSPSLPKVTNVAMAYIAKEYLSSPGSTFAVDVRGRVYPAAVTKMPFVRPNYYVTVAK